MPNIIYIPVDSIVPDPKQPRKIINPSEIAELAQNIKVNGVINAIEVSPDNMIVTGERRWRASKLAGLKVIPCKVVDFTGFARYSRQVAENSQHNTMSPLDTIKSYQKMVDEFRAADPNISAEAAYKKIEELTGRSYKGIRNDLYVLNTPKFVQDAVVAGTMSNSIAARLATKNVPENILNQFQRKAVNEHWTDSHMTSNFMIAARDYPEKVKELLALDTATKRSDEIIVEIDKIAPKRETLLRQKEEEASKPSETLYKTALELVEQMKNCPPDSIPDHNMELTVLALSQAGRNIERFLSVIKSQNIIY